VSTFAGIRHARPSDVPDAVRMGLAFRAAYAPRLRENPAQMATIARWLMEPPNALFVVDLDGAVVGMLGLALVRHPLSDDLYASELFWWLDPPYRKGRPGLGLLEAAETWATQQGAVAMHMIALESNPAVGRLYARRGYTARDVTWEKEF
jgi:RimJ/RimL family protein N-acetyltransferase